MEQGVKRTTQEQGYSRLRLRRYRTQVKYWMPMT